jgi:hypothetical protein
MVNEGMVILLAGALVACANAEIIGIISISSKSTPKAIMHFSKNPNL